MRAVKILATLLGLVAVERFCYMQTAGFRLDKIHSDFTYQGTIPASQETPEILKKPFTFLGSGVQCYAFLSQDGTTVLKVFKHYHNLPITGFLKGMPLPSPLHELRERILAKREKRLQSIFSSCEIAFSLCKDETGLIFLHLQPTQTFHANLTLIDKLGIAYKVDLDTTAFVLQKKAEMFAEKMARLRSKHADTEIQKHLDAVASLIRNRCAKGVENSDLHFERNIGFIGQQAVEVDIGSFRMRNDEKTL